MPPSQRGTCFIFSNLCYCPGNDNGSLLVENGGSVRLNKDWARQVLYRMESKGEKMVRRMGTTSKIPVAPAFLNETKLGYQRRYKSLQQ